MTSLGSVIGDAKYNEGVRHVDTEFQVPLKVKDLNEKAHSLVKELTGLKEMLASVLVPEDYNTALGHKAGNEFIGREMTGEMRELSLKDGSDNVKVGPMDTNSMYTSPSNLCELATRLQDVGILLKDSSRIVANIRTRLAIGGSDDTKK